MPPNTKKQAKKTVGSVITALEKSRNSKVIVYITGDRRQTPPTQIHSDVIPVFKKILNNLGKVKKISLAIYTNGGQLDTPWPLVNLIREHCEEFETIIIEKALSAGTLIALGADTIVMPPHSFLSPVDPAADLPAENNRLKHLEIEDIVGYIDFVKDKIGITEQQSLGEMMKELTREISPTMLGSANRTHALVRRLARKLLGLHRVQVPERQTKEIIEHLTEKLFSHRHLVSRQEAQEIGFDKIIELPNKDTESVIQQLADFYFDMLNLDEDFDPIKILGKNDRGELVITTAVVHSAQLQYNFTGNCILQKVPDPTGNVQIRIDLQTKWAKG